MTTVGLEEAKARLEELLAEGEFTVLLPDGTTLQVGVKPLQRAALKRGGFGSAKGWFGELSDDFDEPLEDFREYME